MVNIFTINSNDNLILDSDPCPDYIEIRGAEQIFSGVYRKTDRKEHGYPVYDGPGDTALSWSHGYWWLSTSSEIGVSDGYAYIGAPMNCPHGPGSLRRGGSDKLIAGATVNDVKINDGRKLALVFFIHDFILR